jgi:uncharacterized lipoprotein NlpE involved in copper resistance
MKKVVLISFALVFILIGCSQDNEQGGSLAGTWTNAFSTIVLRGNGTYSFTIPDEPSITGNYAVVGALITFDSNPSGYSTFQYSLSGNTLSLTVDGGDGTVQTYNKQ